MKQVFFFFLCLFGFISCEVKSKNIQSENTFYTCSMDPQVISNKPGKCPICKMELTKISNYEGTNVDEIQLSDQQIQLGNITTKKLQLNPISDKLILGATLNFDQTKTVSVNARIMGRVEKLYTKTLGEFVSANTPIYELYSEELNNAKQEYLLLLAKKKLFEKEDFLSFDQLLRNAKNKLMLWGLNENQILEIEKNKKPNQTSVFYSSKSGYITSLNIQEGDYVTEGATIMQLADLSSLWAEAKIYTYELYEIDKKNNAVVTIPNFSDKEFVGDIEFVNPEIATDSRINLIRVSIPNFKNQFKPGMAAVVTLTNADKNSIVLPIDAVIRDSKGSKVWVLSGKNTFKSVSVVAGIESESNIEIINGLKPNDIVVITGAYLINSEFVFKNGIKSAIAQEHK